MATFIQDDFDRANNTTDPGSPAVGGPYTVRNSAVAGINTNRFYLSTASGAGTGTHVTFPGSVDIDLSVDVPVLHNSLNFAGLIFRWVDTSNFWYMMANTTNFWLGRAVSGTYQHFHAGTSAASGTFRVVAIGKKVVGFWDGVPFHCLEDQWYGNGASTCGLIARSTTARFDNLIGDDAPTDPFGPANGWRLKGYKTYAEDGAA